MAEGITSIRARALGEEALAPAVPPVNVEAEQALLAALLVQNAAYERVADIVKPEQFAIAVHGRIYAAVAKLIEGGETANPITLKRLFDGDAALEEMGGAKYLVRLAAAVVTIINAADYAREIADLATRRQIIDVAHQLVDMAARRDRSEIAAEAIIEQGEAALFDAAGPGAGAHDLAPVAAAVRAHTAAVEAAYRAGGKALGLGSGLADLDRLTGGLKRRRLIILAGRPGMGKSLVAGVFAFNAARGGHRVAIFSLEQTGELWAARWIARQTGLPTDRQDRGELDGNDWERHIAAAQEIEALPITIDDSPSVGVAHVRQRCRRLKRRGGLDLVIVDHLQKMRQGGRSENRRLEIGEITNGLAAMAKDLDVPVVLVSQLSRATESREDRRPALGDLRESGDIEQDADVVIFIYRRAYYLERQAPERRADESEDKFRSRESDHGALLKPCRNTAELIVDKNRGGRVGTARVFFSAATATVTDLASSGV